MTTSPLSNRIEGRLRMAFDAPEKIVEARTVLGTLDILSQELSYEEILLGIIQLSAGSLDRLHYFSERARKHPTDILMILTQGPALLPDLQEDLEDLLSGGRLERPIPPELLRPQSDDLWSGLPPLVCIVCGELVSRDFFANPHIMLRRTMPEFEEGRMVTAHRHCMALGRQRAEEQGFSWEEVP